MSGDSQPISAEIKAEAAAWLARLRSEDVRPVEQAGFQAWIRGDTRHARAFEQLNTMWEIAGGLEDTYLDEEGQSSVTGRRAVVLSGTALLAATVVGGVYWGGRYDSYTTAIGEQKRISLSDGSRVMLDTDTEIQAKMGDERRQIKMVRGRAHFQVASDVLRPFVVETGQRQVVALGTAFDVLQAPDSSMSVVLFEGRVAVQPAGLASVADGKILLPGERMIFDKTGRGSHDRPDLHLINAWQNGQAVFDNQPLAQAVMEMNRYTRKPLIIADRALASLRISGVYQATDAEGFARSVSLILPASVEVRADRILLRSSGDGAQFSS